MGTQVTTRPATTAQWIMLMSVLASIGVGGFFSLLVLSGMRAYPPEQAFSVKDCMPACVIEDVQYMPQRIHGECWCDMRKRAQTLSD